MSPPEPSPPEPSPQPVDAAPIFAALGDATRLELVSRLNDGAPKSISQLSDGLALTRQGVSKHLVVLEQAGIVASRRVGREHRFSLEPDGFAAVRHYLDRVSEQWDDAISRLKNFVED